MALSRLSELTLLQKSSLSFLVPTALAIASGKWMLACCTALLTYTSLRYHVGPDQEPPPLWIVQLDPTLSRAYTCVYSTIAFMRWVQGGYQNGWYLATVVASGATVGLYAIELAELAALKSERNTEAPTRWLNVFSLHVCVQQCACSACVFYLMALFQ